MRKLATFAYAFAFGVLIYQYLLGKETLLWGAAAAAAPAAVGLAARRAGRYFPLDDRQCAAIRSHMFPLAPMPRNSEAWILTMADKMVASREVSAALWGKMRKLCRRPQRAAA